MFSLLIPSSITWNFTRLIFQIESSLCKLICLLKSHSFNGGGNSLMGNMQTGKKYWYNTQL